MTPDFSPTRVRALVDSLTAPPNTAQWFAARLLAHRTVPDESISSPLINDIAHEVFSTWAQKTPNRKISSRQASSFRKIIIWCEDEGVDIGSLCLTLAQQEKWKTLKSFVRRVDSNEVAHQAVRSLLDAGFHDNYHAQEIMRLSLSIACREFLDKSEDIFFMKTALPTPMLMLTTSNLWEFDGPPLSDISRSVGFFYPDGLDDPVLLTTLAKTSIRLNSMLRTGLFPNSSGTQVQDAITDIDTVVKKAKLQNLVEGFPKTPRSPAPPKPKI